VAELADATAGRADWKTKDTTARDGPLDNSWSGKVNEIAGTLRRAERWHAARISPAGTTRYTSPFHLPNPGRRLD
jgi:hypothetical protein